MSCCLLCRLPLVPAGVPVFVPFFFFRFFSRDTGFVPSWFPGPPRSSWGSRGCPVSILHCLVEEKGLSYHDFLDLLNLALPKPGRSILPNNNLCSIIISWFHPVPGVRGLSPWSFGILFHHHFLVPSGSGQGSG